MASRKISTVKKSAGGFTLIELLIVVGLLLLIGTITLVASFDGYRQYSFRNDRDLVIATLQRARNQAMNSVCKGVGCTEGKSYGIKVESGQLTLFQTDTDYQGRDFLLDETIVLGSSDTTLSGLESVVFERLSGKTALSPSDASLLMSGSSNRRSLIEFNTQGRIMWTN